MNRLLLIITILSLLFSTILFVKEFKTVERWQAKGLKIYHEKLDNFNNWKTSVNPGKPESWLTTNSTFIALKVWIETLSNLASLSIAIISGVGFYRSKKQGKVGV